MIVLRGVEYCTGTPDNPCVMAGAALLLSLVAVARSGRR